MNDEFSALIAATNKMIDLPLYFQYLEDGR